LEIDGDFKKRGTCTRGDNCKFSHIAAEAEGRSPDMQTRELAAATAVRKVIQQMLKAASLDNDAKIKDINEGLALNIVAAGSQAKRVKEEAAEANREITTRHVAILEV
jgi:hypothetical protein